MMATAGTYHCNLSDVTKTMTLDIVLHGVKRFRVRSWLATRLIRLAARILRMDVNITSSDRQYPPSGPKLCNPPEPSNA